MSTPRVRLLVIILLFALPIIGAAFWFSQYDVETERTDRLPVTRPPDDLPTIRKLLRQALQSAGAIPDHLPGPQTLHGSSTLKSWTLQNIAVVRARVGDVAEALETAALAYPDERHRGELLVEIAKVRAAAGDAARARQIVATINEESLDPEALKAIALAAAEGGDAAWALQTVAGLPDSFEQIQIMTEIARVQARAGDRTGAARTIRDALQGAVGDTDALQFVAKAQAETGDLAGALKTAAATPRVFRHSSVLHAIAVARMEAGDLAGALKTAALQTTPGSSAKALTLAAIARVQGRARNRPGAARTFEQALGSVPPFTPAPYGPSQRTIALQGIAEAQAEAGDLAGALKTAMTITENREKTSALYTIAIGHVRAGDKATARKIFGLALQSAGAIYDHNERVVALQWIAVGQAQTGDVNAALAMAAKIPDSPDVTRRATTLQGIAAAQAKAGNWPGALAWAEAKKEHHIKAAALLGVAEGLLIKRNGEKPQRALPRLP